TPTLSARQLEDERSDRPDAARPYTVPLRRAVDHAVSRATASLVAVQVRTCSMAE
ncbi:unnamed protein product, partial [Scytosiphon promiscuus]